MSLRKKDKNTPGTNLYQNFARGNNLGEIVIQLKKKTVPSQWSTSKKNATSISSKPEPPRWSCDTGQGIACFDSSQLTINMDTQKKTVNHGNGGALLCFQGIGV